MFLMSSERSATAFSEADVSVHPQIGPGKAGQIDDTFKDRRTNVDKMVVVALQRDLNWTVLGSHGGGVWVR